MTAQVCMLYSAVPRRRLLQADWIVEAACGFHRTWRTAGTAAYRASTRCLARTGTRWRTTRAGACAPTSSSTSCSSRTRSGGRTSATTASCGTSTTTAPTSSRRSAAWRRAPLNKAPCWALIPVVVVCHAEFCGLCSSWQAIVIVSWLCALFAAHVCACAARQQAFMLPTSSCVTWNSLPAGSAA